MITKIGKIESVKFGISGYQDVCIGIFFTLSFKGTGCITEKSVWDYNLIKHTESCKWTELSRDKQAIEIMKYISKLLFESNKQNVNDLKNVPIEATFTEEFGKLIDFRILTEVL